MVERIAPVEGAPCWVNLATRDMAEAQDFYGSVFGWSFRPASLGEDFCVALTEGVPVAGIGAVARSMGMPVAWTPFFSVADADEIASRAQERCATVAVGPV